MDLLVVLFHRHASMCNMPSRSVFGLLTHTVARVGNYGTKLTRFSKTKTQASHTCLRQEAITLEIFIRWSWDQVPNLEASLAADSSLQYTWERQLFRLSYWQPLSQWEFTAVFYVQKLAFTPGGHKNMRTRSNTTQCKSTLTFAWPL